MNPSEAERSDYSGITDGRDVEEMNLDIGCRKEFSNNNNNNNNNLLISIIVLNWNGLEDTVECIESLERLSYPNREIILVDNGSTDGSQEAVRERFPQVILVQNSENLGFAAGMGEGIRYASG